MSDDAEYVLIERRGGGSFGAFVWGAALGAGVALLLAPRSGNQIRTDLREGVQRLRDRAEGAVRTAQDSVTDRLGGVKSDVRGRMDAARDAFEAGRRAARETHQDARTTRYGAGAAGFGDGGPGLPGGAPGSTDGTEEETGA